MRKKHELSDDQLKIRQGVAEEVAVLMTRRRLSQSDVARALGVDHTWLSRRLNGATPFTTDDLASLADLLGCDLMEFLPAHRLHRKPLLTSVADLVAYQQRDAAYAEMTTSSADRSARARVAVLPRLDSNQQPSGYRAVVVDLAERRALRVAS